MELVQVVLMNLFTASFLLSFFAFFATFAVLFFVSYLQLNTPSDPREFPSNWLNELFYSSKHAKIRSKASFAGAWCISTMIVAGLVWLIFTLFK